MALFPTFVAISILESANCLAVVGLYTMLARRHRISRCTWLRLLSSPTIPFLSMHCMGSTFNLL